MENIKNKIQEFTSIAKECPENLQEKCFELLLSKYLDEINHYQILRQIGLKYMQQLKGKKWIDYNSHDPGIIILEMLCYAMTDLAYRSDYKIEDILDESDSLIGLKIFLDKKVIKKKKTLLKKTIQR
jgi:hypothetical protein